MHDLLRFELPFKIFTEEKQTAFRSNKSLKFLISHRALDVGCLIIEIPPYYQLKRVFLKQNTAAVYIFPKLCYRPTTHILKYIFKYFFLKSSSLFTFTHV